VRITEHPELDLAVATASDQWVSARGHRFGGEEFEGIHPMALNNATDCVRVLFAHAQRYRYTDRYETWVQYASRTLPRRRDLRPLAAELTELESDGVVWTAHSPGALTPRLEHTGESSLPLDTVVARLSD